MPRIIDYAIVLDTLQGQGLRCNYHNAGAFGFPPAAAKDVKTTGWIGPDDPTIRPAAQALARQVAAPYEQELARLAGALWSEHLPGPVWVMPMSHWAYELDFGSRTWMPAALAEAGVDPADLAGRNNGAAIEFAHGEAVEGQRFETLLRRLLEGLTMSDFMLAWPGLPVLCTVHHHKQLWWQTTDAAITAAIDAALPPV